MGQNRSFKSWVLKYLDMKSHSVCNFTFNTYNQNRCYKHDSRQLLNPGDEYVLHASLDFLYIWYISLKRF